MQGVDMKKHRLRWLVAGVAAACGLVGVGVSLPVAQAATDHPDLFWVRPAGASQAPGPDSRVEVHVLDGASIYDKWQMHTASSMNGVSATEWRFVIGDANGDDVADLYALNVAANGNRQTDLHVYDGRTRFTTTILNQVLPSLGATSDADRYQFFAADFDADGRDDLYAVDARDNSAQNTAVHIFDAGDRFETFLAHRRLPGLAAADLQRWQFAGGDLDGDNRADVYMIDGADSGNTKTAVHITTAATGYTKATLNRQMQGFGPTTAARWRYSVADYNGDGKADIFGIDSQDNNGQRTAVHISYADTNFSTSTNRPTTMAAFDLAKNPTITAWKATTAKTHPVDVRSKIAKLANDEVGVRQAACDRYHPSCDRGETAWCAMFATWTWQMAGVPDVPRDIFAARGLGKWGKDHGLFHSTPKVGDWAIFGPPDGQIGGHVDVVVAVHSDTEIVVVGGNVSDRVTKRTINPHTDRMGTANVLISGYVSPPGA
jgi:hypothetical protein